MTFLCDQQLVINHDYRHCPDCGSDQLASVLRDGGSQVYCVHCRNKRWPNRRNEKGERLYNKMVFG